MWSTTLNARGWYFKDVYSTEQIYDNVFCEDANLCDTIFKVTNFERYILDLVIFLSNLLKGYQERISQRK